MSKAGQRRLADKQKRAKTNPRFKMSLLDAERKAAQDEAAASAQRMLDSSGTVSSIIGRKNG